jgi:hypothetical protein
LLARVVGSLLGLVAPHAAKAVDLPADRAEALLHVYDGGGVRAVGPAVLVRKSLADKVSLSASYYLDAVTNASIDVVTTASKYSETRNAYDFGLDYVYRDAQISVTANTSKEPDYVANRVGIDVSQEVYGGMTTVSLGYTRGDDKVGKKDIGFFDTARHWQYRFGVTQILTPRWLAAVNFEAVSDDGYLGSPYRSARVFGAAVPERNPRTRSSRAVKLSTAYDIGSAETRQAVRGSYRYFWDTWDITAHTAEVGYSRYFGERWLADGFLRLHSQSAALFYSDNAQTQTLYLSRNRQLSDFRTIGLGAKVTWSAGRYLQNYDVKLDGALERVRFNYSNFTDVRTGSAYSFDATVLQLLVSATF